MSFETAYKLMSIMSWKLSLAVPMYRTEHHKTDKRKCNRMVTDDFSFLFKDFEVEKQLKWNGIGTKLSTLSKHLTW